MRENVFQAVYSGGLGGRVLFGVTATGKARSAMRQTERGDAEHCAHQRQPARPTQTEDYRRQQAEHGGDSDGTRAAERGYHEHDQAHPTPAPTRSQAYRRLICDTAREQQRQCQSAQKNGSASTT